MSTDATMLPRLPGERLPSDAWAAIERGIKSGEGVRPLLRRLQSEGMDVPSHVSVMRMAKRRGWVPVETQAEEVAQSVGHAADVVRREKDLVVRSQVVDRALQKLTVDELFRGHGESALMDMRTAMDRVVRAGESREIGPGEMAAALNRLAQALAFAREAMEGKRPATAVQINHGQQQQPREVLIPASLVSREK